MGVMDKMKFWKRDEDFGDLGNLDDFSLDDKPGGGIPHDADPGAMGHLPNLEEPTAAGMETGVPTKIEELQPSDTSAQMGEQLGLTGAGTQPPAQPQMVSPSAQTMRPQQQPSAYPQHQATGVVELGKEIEIMHAKIDAIRSTLETINQRLASLERMASGTDKKRYTW